jgi:isoleucyl-tRNA synthetase
MVVALAKLMAPILSFTADEIWRMLPDSGRRGATSVHLAPFPDGESVWRDEGLATRWDKLLAYRTRVQGELEARRRDKVIGSSLEAHVQIEAGPDAYRFLTAHAGDLSTIFIVSRVTVKQTEMGQADIQITVEKSDAAKCERCWNYRDAVGKDAAHPTLCDRCVEAIR